ncbi:hypothetical protein PHMEG_00016192 [Phytophthora megakarya]|uniref:Uncharacterized protein n=1 Tax=Phytophthora megakarya TaxID=4795 RepID=A0A225W200_9STRA|nr:hypothetical protein PHMEG_00016192 [Phytophthora megakarya]
MLQKLENLCPYLHVFQDDCGLGSDLPVDATNTDNMRKVALVNHIPSVSERGKTLRLLDEMTAFGVITGKL